MNQSQIEALRMLSDLTRGTYNVYALAGPHGMASRQKILGLITGEKPTRSQSGVNAVRDSFYALAGIDTSCMTLRSAELAFVDWAVKTNP